MKTRLNLTIEESLLEKVKTYAAKQRTSVSQIVEAYFISITRKSRKKSLLDVIEDLPQPKISFPKDFDFEKAYYEEKGK